MAQQDTGLGWSAKDNWLVSLSSVYWKLGNYTGAIQLPYAGSANDAAIAGVVIGTATWNSRPCTIRAAANSDNSFIAISASSYIVLSSKYGTIMYIVVVDDGDGRIQWSPTETADNSYNNMYYGYGVGVTGTVDPALDQYRYYSPQAAIDALSFVGNDVTKTNSGYAVGCVATWKTESNVVFTSPILISSDTDFAEMATQENVSFAKLRVQYDGFNFYMGFFANSTLSVQSSLPRYDLTEASPSTYATLEILFKVLAASFCSNILVTDAPDPYQDFGNTGEDSGEPDPNPEDDDIEEDDLPTTSFADAGFCRIYKPSLQQLNDLANYMWTDQTFLQTVINHLKQILENPIDSIISLSLVPCVPSTGSSTEVKVMYIPTGVYMPPVINQFVEVDCGTFTLKEMYGSALDYNPYTSVQLYLPYVGIVQLDTDEVMGKTIHIGYRIDVVTGVCCAYVKAGADVLYQFSGHCAIQQPITSADFSGYVGAAIAAGKLVASIAAAGAGAPEVSATLAGAPTPSISGTSSETRITERNEATGRQITAGTRRRETVTENPGASFGEVATRGISNTVGAVMNSKTIVQHSGGFSGNSGYLAAVRRPYLIVTRPRIANPENYGQYNGRPSMIYLNLGNCTGYTQVQSIQLTGIDATNPELSEISTLLMSGVIF